MSQRVRRGLLTLLFGLAQVFVLILFMICMYYIGHLQLALDIIEVTGAENANTAQLLVAGSVLSFFTALVLTIMGVIGYLTYLWGKFTQKKATKWNRKINNKLYGWQEKKRARAALVRQDPDWEV